MRLNLICFCCIAATGLGVGSKCGPLPKCTPIACKTICEDGYGKGTRFTCAEPNVCCCIYNASVIAWRTTIECPQPHGIGLSLIAWQMYRFGLKYMKEINKIRRKWKWVGEIVVENKFQWIKQICAVFNNILYHLLAKKFQTPDSSTDKCSVQNKL